ncbi:MAG TPA: ABC transporter permease [Candidatus Lokiarchaeia archaeon]|nr:ABC transporter permease [Candidatus Lokiarchaeia archaeon]
MLNGIWAIWKREMRKWRRNKTQLVSSLLLPVLFLIIVGNAYSGSFSHIKIAIVNQDSTETPGQIYEQYLENSTTFDVVTNTTSLDDALVLIDQGVISGVFVIPANFSQGLLHQATVGTQINVTVDNTNFMVAQAINGTASLVLNQTLNDPQVITWFTTEINKLPLQERFVPSNEAPVNGLNRYGNADYKFIDFLAPGILAMTVLFTSLFTAGMPIMLDREIGYFDMLLSTPAKRSQLVLGFTLAGVTKVVTQATFVLIIALLLGVHMSYDIFSILNMYLIVIVLSLGFVGISIALSVKIELNSFQFVNGLINFPVFFLSASFFPLESLPNWLRIAVELNPMYYGVHALRAVMIKGTSLLNVLPDLGIIAIFALITQLLGNFMLYATLVGKSSRKTRKRRKDQNIEEVLPK